jgi:hypothetical protein
MNTAARKTKLFSQNPPYEKFRNLPLSQLSPLSFIENGGDPGVRLRKRHQKKGCAEHD